MKVRRNNSSHRKAKTFAQGLLSSKFTVNNSSSRKAKISAQGLQCLPYFTSVIFVFYKFAF